MDTYSIVPPPSGHARLTALMPLVKGDDAHPTKPSRRPVKPQTPAPDPLRRGNIALLAVLEGLPDATVGATRDGRIVFCNGLAEQQFGYDRKELIGAADRDPVAGTRARALQAQPGALLRARSPAALHRARLRPVQGRQRVHRRDELGHRRQRRRPAAAGDRPQHLRAAPDRAAAAPAVRAAGGGRRARRARAARPRPRRAQQGGGRAGARRARRGARGGARRAARDRRLGRAGARREQGQRPDPHRRPRARRARGRIVDGGRVRRGGGLVPAGRRQRAGDRLLAPAHSRSRCASRRCTTR